MNNDVPILYAENDPNDVFLMRRALQLAKIANTLITVENGQLAIDYLAGNGAYQDRTENPLPCLVMLDLKMPVRSGLDVLKWVRSNPSTAAVPVLMLTSSNQDSDIHRAYLNGANGFLIKPGKPNELLMMVKGINDFWLKQKQPSVM